MFTVLPRKLTPKCQDLGSFIILVKICNISLEKAMLDIRASFNRMIYNICASINIGPLKEIGIIIQFIDRTNVHPKDAIEDVLV